MTRKYLLADQKCCSYKRKEKTEGVGAESSCLSLRASLLSLTASHEYKINSRYCRVVVLCFCGLDTPTPVRCLALSKLHVIFLFVVIRRLRMETAFVTP